MNYNKRISKLSNMRFAKPDKVLSLYIHTDRSHPDQQGGEWKIALKNGFNRLEEYLELSSKDELIRLQSIRSKVEKYMDGLERQLPRGIVIFASEDSSVWETFELQIPVETNFYWEDHAVVDQLTALYKDHPLTALILMQQNQIKILSSVLSVLQDKEMLEFDLDLEDWRKHEGPSHVSASMGKGNVKSASQVDHFQDRVKMNQHRWIKSLGSMIDKKAADQGWEKIILIGDKEEAQLLNDSMNKQVDKIIQKNLLNENEHTVLEKVL